MKLPEPSTFLKAGSLQLPEFFPLWLLVHVLCLSMRSIFQVYLVDAYIVIAFQFPL